jgi:hypothetical protein
MNHELIDTNSREGSLIMFSCTIITSRRAVRVKTEIAKQWRETHIKPVVPVQLDLVLSFPFIYFALVPVYYTSVGIEKLSRGCLDPPECVLY